MTHNREWKQFVRAPSAPEKTPVDLRPFCTNSRVSAFDILLEAGRDLDKMSVVFKRKMIKKSLVMQKRGGQMLSEMQKMYGNEKAGTLAERLNKSGLWYYDPNFPQDPEFKHYILYARIRMQR